eukprot:g21269.t1
MTEQQVQGLREVFGLFDPEGSGRVRPDEIRTAASNAGLEKEYPEVWQLLAGLESHESAKLTEPENGEAIHGQVFVAVNITRGMPWFRKDAEPGWFVVGGRRAAERLNADWLDASTGKRVQLLEKYCSFCLFLMTAVFVFITVAISVLNQEHSAALMITSGVLLGVTTMCCFCMNFRRMELQWGPMEK